MLTNVIENRDYIHIKTQNKYTVKEIGLYQTKKGNWVDCVIYYTDSHGLHTSFVRKLKNFKKSFELVEIQS